MPTEKQTPYNKLVLNQLIESELIKGRNGIALFHEWSRLPESSDNCSREEIARSYRIRGD